MDFSDLIGQEIAVLIPKIHQTALQQVKLIGVESGGIWVQSKQRRVLWSKLCATALWPPAFKP
ncbi:MAG: hypothetical protein ACRD2P_14495 [Terriglobia bacterium]